MARTAGSHSDITGPRIQRAALSLFARQGYAAVSMRQIAAQVGVQAGALYNYTPDKQSLLFGLMRDHMEELLATWRARAGSGSPMARLEDFTRFHIRFHLTRPEEVFIAYMELRNLSPENFAVIEGLRGDYEDALEEILRAGVEAGVFDVPDPKIATLAVIAMLTGVNTWYRSGGRLSLEEVETIYWDMVRKAVGVAPA
ncbi:TetR/AcrR family transcriptional regulator [Pseudodonghicola flavimaris]|uniref:TetR/AcrR family transcriptional regulator n=1 Tax=Pseudodonghicola flavimaris TaxID=3050036 RepID=A0ABT7F4F4_9RHOB|nr:TetR/AcrR family transcriptional regulator [Pseudodonghicola flavimaris]MDK3019481.1 TetR/AcrR family transcriptional regulator [Pseudodonghicola flavimaris]